MGNEGSESLGDLFWKKPVDALYLMIRLRLLDNLR